MLRNMDHASIKRYLNQAGEHQVITATLLLMYALMAKFGIPQQ